MNHNAVLADFSFAMKPPALSSMSDETTEFSTTAPLPLSSESTTTSTTAQPPHDDNNDMVSSSPQQKAGKKIKALGKKLGGALQKINVVKWIDDLENDQELADDLNRLNAEIADEQQRKELVREATEACLKAMRDHLLDFLKVNPQATYEEWICNLHPENINVAMNGLTQTPMIDHRFYVQESDHRVLWNEHLNDLNDTTNLTPVRHYVAARTMIKKPSNLQSGSDGDNNMAPPNSADENLIGFSDEPTAAKAVSQPNTDLLLGFGGEDSPSNQQENISNQQQQKNGEVDLLAM